MTGGGAFIYLALAGMWALVLVPLWLRNHDQAQESRSADRFARAMGSLRRDSRGSLTVGDSHEVLMPGRSRAVRDTEVTVTGPSYLTSTRSAAQRRLRTLAVLGALVVVWVVLVALHKAPTYSLVLPVGLVVGFLVIARRQTALASEIRRRQAHREALTDAARAAETRYDATRQLARRGGRAVDPQPVRRAAPVEAPEPVYLAPTADGTSWSAVPTTLPTYVTAPRATKVPRVIDLTTPGSWSGAAMVAQARETLAPEPVAESGMRVESFEIAVPRDPAVRAGVFVEPSTYSDRYVSDDRAMEALANADDSLESLLDDPRTGVQAPTWRRAANG